MKKGAMGFNRSYNGDIIPRSGLKLKEFIWRLALFFPTQPLIKTR